MNGRARAAFLVALVPFLALVWRFDFLCDDAYITFRYARNLAAGLGPVYNPGELVEGYTEPLWMFVLALGRLVGIPPMVLSRVLSVAAGILLVRATAAALARGPRGGPEPGPVATHGAALYLGCLPPLAVWSTGGLATMPFAWAVTALFLGTWWRDEPAPAWRLGLLGAGVALLRADGAWWTAAVLGPAIVAGALRGHGRLRGRALGGALLAAGLFGVHLLWRWWTYGDWLPNTARVKVGFGAWSLERGGRYLLHGFVTLPGIALALALGLRALGRGGIGAAYGVVLATCAHVVLASGDFMAFHRFLVPMLPASALVLAAGLSRFEAGGAGRPLAAILAAACVLGVLTPAFGVHATPAGWREALAFRFNRPTAGERSELEQWELMRGQAEEWADLGRALGLVSEPGDSLVYSAVGALGYFSDLHVYDRNGLVTREVALRPPLARRRSPGHDKTVPGEFFARYEPTFPYVMWWEKRLGDWRRNPGLRAQIGGALVDRLRALPLDPALSPRPDCVLLVDGGTP